MKNLKLNTISFLALLLTVFGMISSCDRFIPGPKVNVSDWILCSLVDSLGRELVNPQHPEIFDWRKIQVFDLIDGKKVKRKPKVDAKPDNEISFDFDTLSENGHYLIQLGLASWDDIWDKVKERTRVVQWNEFTADTFHTTFKTSANHYAIDEFEINGKKFTYGDKNRKHCFGIFPDANGQVTDTMCGIKFVIKL